MHKRMKIRSYTSYYKSCYFSSIPKQYGSLPTTGAFQDHCAVGWRLCMIVYSSFHNDESKLQVGWWRLPSNHSKPIEQNREKMLCYHGNIMEQIWDARMILGLQKAEKDTGCVERQRSKPRKSSVDHKQLLGVFSIKEVNSRDRSWNRSIFSNITNSASFKNSNCLSELTIGWHTVIADYTEHSAWRQSREHASYRRSRFAMNW